MGAILVQERLCQDPWQFFRMKPRARCTPLVLAGVLLLWGAWSHESFACQGQDKTCREAEVQAEAKAEEAGLKALDVIFVNLCVFCKEIGSTIFFQPILVTRLVCYTLSRR